MGFIKPKGFYEMHGLLTNGQEQFRPRSHDPQHYLLVVNITRVYSILFRLCSPKRLLSSELGARQAQREVVKIKNFDFSYWA